MSTSQKHRCFVMEPMGDKMITDIAGIGPAYGKRLQERGFISAFSLLGMFLIQQKSVQMFSQWLISEFKMSKKNATDSAHCLDTWCKTFL